MSPRRSARDDFEAVFEFRRYFAPVPTDSPFQTSDEQISAQFSALKTKEKTPNEPQQSDRPQQ